MAASVCYLLLSPARRSKKKHAPGGRKKKQTARPKGERTCCLFVGGRSSLGLDRPSSPTPCPCLLVSPPASSEQRTNRLVERLRDYRRMDSCVCWLADCLFFVLFHPPTATPRMNEKDGIVCVVCSFFFPAVKLKRIRRREEEERTCPAERRNQSSVNPRLKARRA